MRIVFPYKGKYDIIFIGIICNITRFGELWRVKYDNMININTEDRHEMISKYIFVLLISLAVSFITSQTLWEKNVYLFHTILELTCTFISLATFLLIWNTYEKTLNLNHFIGFGFLSVAIFNMFHTYYFLNVGKASAGCSDITARYWMIEGLIEAIVLAIVSLKVIRFRIDKWVGLICTIFFSFGISLIMQFPSVLPAMMTEEGSTPTKIALEYIIIILTIVSIYNLKDHLNDNLNDERIISFKYIFMALLIIFPAELVFVLFKELTSFYSTFGHILKILFYYYFYRAVFVSSVTYPYERLEDSKNKVTHLSENLGDLLDALPIATLMYDIDGNLEYVNKKFEEIFVCSKDKLYDCSAEEIQSMFLDKEQNEKTVYEMTLESGEGLKRIIKTYKIENGDYIKLAATSHRTHNGILVLLNDIKKEQELENLQFQTQTILNSIKKLIIILDKDNKIIMCNKEYEKVIGLSAKNIIGMDVNKHKSMLQMHIDKEYGQEDINNTKSKNYEIEIVTIDKIRKRLLYNSSKIHNIDGELIGLIVIASDITELKEQQEKMMQQEKLALLGQMGAGIVHETRNYLTTIKGSCQIIDTLTEEDRIKKYIKKMNKGIDEVNRIIGEFLSLSKPRETKLEEVSMYDIVHSIKSLIITSSLISGINIDFNLSKEERYLLCDEAQVKQVVLNICKNAVEAMAEIKNADLKIEAGYNEKENEMFIKIADTGYGMTKETLKKIGTPFYTTKSNGTGLGLNFCYKIIKEHRGRIEVESELEKGTVFIVVLPCIEDDEEYDKVM